MAPEPWRTFGRFEWTVVAIFVVLCIAGAVVAHSVAKLAGAGIVFFGGVVLAGVTLYHSANETH